MSKMCILPLLMYFLVHLVNAKTREATFTQDTSLLGHTCPENRILFKGNFRKLECASLCTGNRKCLSIVFDTDTTECFGCSSFEAVMETPGSNTLFFKLPIYIGCLEDNMDRLLPEYFKKFEYSMTTKICIETCTDENYAYAMTQFSYDCHCGSSGEFLDLDVQRPESECNSPCSGDDTERCGGNWRGSTYRTGLSPSD